MNLRLALGDSEISQTSRENQRRRPVDWNLGTHHQVSQGPLRGDDTPV